MTDQEAFTVIGERMQTCANDQQVQRTMVEITRVEGKEAAEKWLFWFALATLMK